MIYFFRSKSRSIIAVKAQEIADNETFKALEWLFDGNQMAKKAIDGIFIGPRREMVTPWSTSAVEITQNMNIKSIERIEEYFPVRKSKVGYSYDKMLQRVYNGLDQSIFDVKNSAEPIVYISDLQKYNEQEGLALSREEVEYLQTLSKRLKRKLTDSEVFGFSQVNSEHCRHKIFNGKFIIDGKERESTLFQLIKNTSKANPNLIVSAYKDNCAFIKGPAIKMFTPKSASKPDYFGVKKHNTVISLKAETHNFPTTVEPFNGAATGTGGEIRDRMAGGKGSFPIAGTAVYMTSYPRLDKSSKNSEYKKNIDANKERKWLYQSPQEILTKASNGASDFGNKFGQSIICGSLLTFEHVGKHTGAEKDNPDFGYDKVIMLAGGIGYAKSKDAIKGEPQKGDKLVLLGGDNYRIGMGGGAVSSVNTGEYGDQIELNAIQRANAEMQKRAYNAIRALAEKESNPIISVHDHGAGGHLNCLSELVEGQGGKIDISALPVGDPTLSLKEIIGNESQERMGIAINQKHIKEFRAIAARERAPFYEIGVVDDDKIFLLKDEKSGEVAINLKLEDMFGNAPKTVMCDTTSDYRFNATKPYNTNNSANLKDYVKSFKKQLEHVLKLESVACKDWLTNKVDRSVTGLIANQQCCGEIQLPLNNLGVVAIGYEDKEGIATSIGHAPIAALIDPCKGSRLAIAEALTNLVWTPVEGGLKGISLSANWMWPSRNKGEDSRLYRAVESASKFAIELGINIPTGKDSMSMTQNYPNGKKVLAPGTVIISTVAPAKEITKVVRPNIQHVAKSCFIYIPFSTSSCELGGSAYYQSLDIIGNDAPDIADPQYFAKCFETVQKLIEEDIILSGHDVSSGGLITTLLEMCFATTKGGMDISQVEIPLLNFFFSEKPAIVVQVADNKLDRFYTIIEQADKSHPNCESIKTIPLGKYSSRREINILNTIKLDIDKFRDTWYRKSYLMEQFQTHISLAYQRAQNYKNQPLIYKFPKSFSSDRLSNILEKNDKERNSNNTPIAAIIREKGSNGDREMAWALYSAGFKVKDVHMTDLTSGREDLSDVQMAVFVGGFSNADTLGSAKGWAGAFLYNEKANRALNNFYNRKDTLSLGVCNGCQLMAELGLLTPKHRELSPKMQHNDSHKFESEFVSVKIRKSNSILLKSLENSKLGVWVAHGEGKFSFPNTRISKGGIISAKDGTPQMHIAMQYAYNDYPANPNGSPNAIAGVCSADGRHLAIMPHPERALKAWNWAYYPENRAGDLHSPWIEIFINGYNWCKRAKK